MARVARVGGEYGADHLTHLEGLDAVRKRPGMYIGSTDSRGVNHLVNEILDNAVDEAVAGFCSEITVTLHPDGSVEVADSGRGIPVDVNTKTGLSGVELVFTRLHAGGKFGGKSYNTSGGLHGVGASVVNALSLRLDVTVRRGGRVHTVSFQHGVSGRFDGAGAKAVFTPAVGLRVVGKCPVGQTGTTIRYWYDPAYFLPGAELQVDALVTKLRNTAFLVPGLSLTLRDARGGAIDEQTFRFPDGLADMVDFLTPAGDRGVCDTLVFTGEGAYRENAADENGVMRTNVERRCEVEVAVRWGTGYETTVECFTNVIRNVHGGTHRKGFERGLTRVLVDTIRNTRGLLKANEDPPVLDDILEGLVAVVHVRVPEPQFTSQTKDELSTAGVAKAVQAVVEREVKAWLDGRRTKPQARVVLEKIVAAARVRLVQKQQKETARRKTALEGGSMPAKLADCRETGVARSELFIVEGDSAAGCFSGDTRVALVDGRSLTFAELAADWQSGVMHFGYATDEFGDVVVVPLDAPRITKRGAALVAVTLDNGEVLRCTPDHLFRLRDGSYRRADALKGGDSLMPLYRDLSRKDRGHSIDGYERVFLNSAGRWQYTHHLADAWNLSQGLDSQGNGPVRHHVDFNKRNNDPRNLVRMTKEGYCRFGSIDALRDAASKLNHKVVRVESLTETEDVYDLTVDTYHNFALEAGVFVHNSAKKGRSSEYQAILPIRGKILNVAKASLKAALENAECAAIIQTVGAGSGRTFDVERMRYQRVIVLADADVDGAHIRCLLLTFFYRYMRPMVEAGRLYAAMPPLYKITTRGQGSETVLAYTQADMESTVRRLEGQGKQILTPIPRFKGLGEMDAGELWQSTMNPATRSVRRITVDDAAQAETYLDLLMGDRVEPRRDWIVEFGDQVDRDALDA